MYPSILQTKIWSDFQSSLGQKTFFKQAKNYQYTAILKTTPLGNYLYLPYGPYLKNPQDFNKVLASLKQLAAENNAFFIRIEPQFQLSKPQIKQNHLKKTKDLNPHQTRIIDLTRSEEDILKDIEKRKVRQWRNCSKKNVTIRVSDNPEKDIEILNDLLGKLSHNNGFLAHDPKYLAKQAKEDFAKLYLVELTEDGKTFPIGAGLVYDDENGRYSMHYAADDNYKKLGACILMTIQYIIDAKNAGLKFIDLWGVTTSTDPKHPWYGFSQFKACFGGEIVEFSGDYDLVLNHAKYFSYHLLRPLNRLKRKITRK